MKTFDEIDTQETPSQVLERVRSSARESCETACVKARHLVAKNPIPTVFGALVFGAAVGYLVYSRREQFSLPDRLTKEANSLRKALSSGSDRLSSLLHDGVDTASHHAKKASAFVHGIPADDILHSASDSLNSIYNRLKFW